MIPLLGSGKTMTYVGYMFSSINRWIIVNSIIIIIAACVYWWVDVDREESYFNGINSKGKRSFYEYLYFSVIITSTLGLGEIVPRKVDYSTDKKPVENKSLGRVMVASHIMMSLLLNDMVDSHENFILS